MKIIIEGLWGVGKTTFCQRLRDEYGFVYILEPDHKKTKGTIPDLDKWYLNEHNKNITKLMQIDGSAVVERSIISTIAFIRAIGKSVGYGKNLLETIDPKVYENIDALIILLVDANPNKHIYKINDVVYSDDFIKSYIKFLKYYAQKIFGKKRVIMKIDSNLDVINNKDTINKLLQKIEHAKQQKNK